MKNKKSSMYYMINFIGISRTSWWKRILLFFRPIIAVHFVSGKKDYVIYCKKLLGIVYVVKV